MAAYVALVAAYALGSIPSALLVGRALAGVDIRTIGDGNMGARNVTHTLGWRPGIAVAVFDFCNGALEWQMLAGASVVLGHDFPIFAGLRGGQGFATIPAPAVPSRERDVPIVANPEHGLPRRSMSAQG